MLKMLNDVHSSINYDGTFTNIDTTYYGKPIFRKWCGWKDVELHVAKILKSNPHPNIVSIYTVEPWYIDMELLDKIENLSSHDIAKLEIAKDYLQSLGIYYIDWKIQNLGRDENGEIKIFDFNFSYLIKDETIIRPFYYSKAEHFARMLFKKTYKDIDDLCFKTLYSKTYYYLKLILG